MATPNVRDLYSTLLNPTFFNLFKKAFLLGNASTDCGK